MRFARASASRVTERRATVRSVPIAGAPAGGGRGDLLRVAINLFALRGFAGTSMRDIASAAECSVANVYHHYRNKEALWLAVLEGSIDDLPAALLAAANQVSGNGIATPFDRFERLVRAHVATSHRFPRELQILFIDEGRLSPESNAINRRLQHAIFRLYLDELRLLVRDGFVVATDLRIKALNVLGVINWHLRWMVREATPAQRLIEVNAIVAFVLRALDERNST